MATSGGDSGATIRAVAMAIPDRRVPNGEIARAIGVDEHVIFPLDLRVFGGSARQARHRSPGVSIRH